MSDAEVLSQILHYSTHLKQYHTKESSESRGELFALLCIELKIKRWRHLVDVAVFRAKTRRGCAQCYDSG